MQDGSAHPGEVGVVDVICPAAMVGDRGRLRWGAGGSEVLFGRGLVGHREAGETRKGGGRGLGGR